MANHPVVGVSWYGARAFCLHYGYSLPTEWEWQAAADYDGSYDYPCGTTIDTSKVNYLQANPLNLSQDPYTTPVDHYPSYGYGLNDMGGNVWEWTSTFDVNMDGSVILRGGAWNSPEDECSVSGHRSLDRAGRTNYNGFRVCRRAPHGMALVPGGAFEMGAHHAEGSSNELPVHAVVLDSFFMSRYEITNRQYCGYLNSAYNSGEIKVDAGAVYASSDDSNSMPYCNIHNSSSSSQIDYNDVSGIFSVRTKGGRDMSNDPMVEVSWYGAVAYCNRRSQEEGYQILYDFSDANLPCDFTKKGYRLPTEAEWEYAARGGMHRPYYLFPWGDTINHDYANYYANASAFSYDTSPYSTSTCHPDWNDGIYPYTAPVGSFSANGYGLYDMAGNVWEWCNDWYDEDYYDLSPHDGPQGPAVGTYRVLRGGSWYYHAYYCRAASRSYFYLVPDIRNYFNGFRLVLDLN